MTMRYIKPVWAFMIVGVLLVGTVQARTSDAGDKPVKVKKSRTKTVAYDDPNPYLHGSKETVKQRDRRLSRECKGRVNAGACEGYTR